MATEQTNRFDQGTSFEDGNVLEFQKTRATEAENPGFITFDELQERRKQQERQLERDRMEREAMGLSVAEVIPLRRHQEIGRIGSDIDEFRSDRLAS